MYSIEKFIAHSNRFWTIFILSATFGIVTGFAIPMASSYQSQRFYQPAASQVAESSVLVIPTVQAQPNEVTGMVVPMENRDSTVAKLAARNRRLEALVVTLRKKSHSTHHPKK